MTALHLVPPPMQLTGSLLRREALELGIDDREIERLLRARAWIRIRRGAYALRPQWLGLTPEQRHLVTARAVLRSLDEPAVLGHVSAAIALGLPVWGADLSTVHVIRDGRHGARVEAGVAHHVAELPSEHVTRVGGIEVTTASRTVVDHARSCGFEPAVVTADAALHARLTTRSELRETLFWMSDWPGARAAGRVVAFADGRAESVGESRGRVFCLVNGLPIPELQVEIRDDDGVLVARVDFLFDEQRTVGEFDGKVKYRADTAGVSPEEVVWLEKRREDSIRGLGWECVRLVWGDYDTPALTRRRFLDAFARGTVHGRRPHR